MSLDDLALLRDYTDGGSQTAFATIVRRHVDLVYSVALRQVRSPHLAEEVAQTVFFDLARNAGRLRPGTHLAAWLHAVARRTAIDVVRRESRRRAREARAAETADIENLHAMNTPPADWTALAPLLDDAVEALSATDRSAVLLRFFENKNYREIGDQLGVSDDAAQKRVSRAIEQLRAFFARKGFTISAVGLATTLAAHAVETAPAALGTSIVTATAATAAVQVTAGATLSTAQTLTMTATQKIIAAAVVGAGLALAFYEGMATWHARQEMLLGQQRLEELAETARAARREQIAAARRLADLQSGRGVGEPAPEPGSDAALERAAFAWFARIERIKRAFAEHPERAIPELQLLSEQDWLLASRNADSSDNDRIGDSLQFLRTRAKAAFTKQVSDAARKYFSAAHSVLPERFDQLASLPMPPLGPEILDRYDFQNERGRVVIAEKLAGAIDLDRLTIIVLEGRTGRGGVNAYTGTETVPARLVREAAQAYARSHGGAPATDPAQLAPLLSPPMEPGELAKLFTQMPLSRAAISRGTP